jgi:elongation factor G
MNTISLSLSRWRNLGIIAHIDAGKTTLTERLLWKTGAIHRTGEVHDGATTTDYSPIERKRGITIGAAAVRTHWTRDDVEHRLTLIDTPGHIDFAIEVERSLRVLDGAVAVFSAVDGVQPQSETVWRQARRHGVPLIAFVNKMDRIGASFDRVLSDVRDKLNARPWPLGLPIGAESDFVGWVDLVARRVLHWDGEGGFESQAWNDDEAALYAAHRQRLIEAVAEHDDVLAQAFVEECTIDDDMLRAALRRGTLAGAGVPVLAGSAFKNKGVESLLDAIVDYLPSPLDRPPVRTAYVGGERELSADPSAPLAALVFKVADIGNALLSFVRVYSGTLRVGDAVWCSQAERLRRVGRLVTVQADRVRDIDHAVAGDIVAVLGWKDAVSGETLSCDGDRFALDRIRTQAAVLSWRLSAENSSDLIRMAQGLASLAQQDPSFRVGTDPQTGETLVWGMGELHLDVTIERLRSDWNVPVRVGTPRVAYQETPSAYAHGVDGKVDKQNGGVGQYARVTLDIAPRDDGEVTFVDRTVGGVVPKAFVQATEKGVRAALAQGPRGYPVVGIEVVLVDGETHSKDSSDLAFQRAAADAVAAALAQAGTTLLEPVMDLVVETPSAHVGDVIGDVQRRSGRVLAIESRAQLGEGAEAVVLAQAPLAQLQGYATALRSLTQGRASAQMSFTAYAPVKT